ncbi:MAG: hypothetical protein FWD23_08595 [Oscillospiraceae bacterium]|nr:hypothetical protein [Oscillospiraceae bacterium]
MKKRLALYYSFDENAKKMAQTKAKELKADTAVEVKETKQRSKFNVMTSGALEAMRMKKAEIEPLTVNFDDYGTIILIMPAWGGNPAPAMNSIIGLIPGGKEVEIYMISPKGNSMKSADNTSNEIQKRGSHVTKYVDLKIG